MSFADAGYRMRYMEWAKTVMEAGLPGVIDIGSSGIAPVRLRDLGVAIRDLELFGPHFYGEPVLRARIARHASVSEDRVLPTLGASHALFLLCASLLRPGDEAIVERPGYEALTAVPHALGARVKFLDRRFENGFQIEPGDLARLRTSRTRLILVTNPHNPSGIALSREGLDALASCAAGGGRTARNLETGIWVIVNEVYREFLQRDPPPAGHTLGPRGVSLSSLTKFHGLGETRVGWAIGDRALIHRASRVNDFGPVNGPYIAERVGAIALARRPRLVRRTRAIMEKNRPILHRFLEMTPALETVVPPEGIVVFPRLRKTHDTRMFAERALVRQKVCVVPGRFFGSPGHLRIGIGARDPRRIAEGLRRLGRAIADAGDA